MCQQEVTHREYLIWEAWVELEWGRPSRSDNYLMQIVVEVARVLSKNPNNIKMKDKLLKFVAPVAPNSNPEARLAQSKAMWSALAGKKPSH